MIKTNVGSSVNPIPLQAGAEGFMSTFEEMTQIKNIILKNIIE